MATTTRKAPAKKAPAKRATARKTTAKKPVRKTASASFKQSAEKAVNVYFGVIGQGIDMVKENLEDKRIKQLEKRGIKLRSELSKRFDKVEIPELETAVKDAKVQFSKMQDQVEEAVDSAKEKLKAA